MYHSGRGVLEFTLPSPVQTVDSGKRSTLDLWDLLQYYSLYWISVFLIMRCLSEYTPQILSLRISDFLATNSPRPLLPLKYKLPPSQSQNGLLLLDLYLPHYKRVTLA